MYSRNQGRDQKLRELDWGEPYDGMSDEEYEIYKYNLPPKYDGSRFRRNRQRESRTEVEIVPVECDSVPNEEQKAEPEKEEEVCCEPETVTVEELREKETENLPAESKTESHSLLPRLTGSIGYEELLIIALILAIANGDDSGDVLLLLAVLLTQK